MGWSGHEIQWGHDPGSRFRDVQDLYRTDNLMEAAKLLQRYDVRYVFVGSLEREDYSASSLAKFDRLGRVAFRSGNAVVYDVAGVGSTR